MKTIIFGGRRRAAAMALTLCLGAVLAAALVTRGHAFTLIELIVKFDAVEILPGSQTAHVVFNNTFGAQAVHVEINWGDAINGSPIGLPYSADVIPGHGVIALLPAVQTGGDGALASRAIIVVCKLSPGNGSQSLPYDIGGRISGTFEVLDKATGHVMLARGLSTVPAVQ